MKKSRIVMISCLIVNALSELVFPYALMVVIFAASTFAAWFVFTVCAVAALATAVIANVAAGYGLRTRWFSVLLPAVIFVVSWIIAVGKPGKKDTLFVLSIAAALLIVSVLSAIISAKRKKKKEFLSGDVGDGNLKEIQ